MTKEDELKRNPSVLMIEDEESNIWTLKRTLNAIIEGINAQSRRFPGKIEHYSTEHVSSAEEAMKSLNEVMRQEKRYGAIITDNHLGRAGLDVLDINGDDLLHIILGYAGYALSHLSGDADLHIKEMKSFDELNENFGGKESPIDEFLRESFDDSFPAYKNFVNYWFGNPRTSPHLIMLCGHPSETQLEGIEPYVDVVHKTWDLEGITCERAVINILVNKKVLPRDIASAVMQQDNRLREGASPRRRRYTPGKS